MFMQLLSYLGLTLGFSLIVLSIACGLYYLSELVEEHTVVTKRLIKYITLVVLGIHALLLFDGLPFWRIGFSVLCHGVYSLNLSNFPFINLLGVPFIASCAMVLADHFLWFQYFTIRPTPVTHIGSFFAICVWLVPFIYFISLSANDLTLPNYGSVSSQPTPSSPQVGSINIQRRYKGTGLLKSFLNVILRKGDDVLPRSGSTNKEF
ncbi:erv26 superfamily protein [Basidiobolus ranarum]|uniref:Erv26 superfamily protein n=1 Tax=Basidiobolus ranarum TaxID=34480 RepID=A0ABR2VTA4_9FUNG